MPQTLIKKCCVKVRITDSQNNDLNQGSGVILKCREKFFVLTAYHCIYGEEDQFCDVHISNIWIGRQQDFAAEFVPIRVLAIECCLKQHDLILLSVEDPLLQISFINVCIAHNFIEEEEVYFRGFQSFNPNESRLWKAKVLDISASEFKITLTEKTFNQGGELGSDMAKGLSGSGVFVVRNGKIFLIGHLKTVIREIALNDDIKCCKLSNLKESIDENFVDLGDLNELDMWERSSSREKTLEDLTQWRQQNNNYFNNLNRKALVVYADRNPEEVINERILDFLQQESENDHLRSVSDILTKLDRTSIQFEKTVKNEYTRQVCTTNDAKNLLINVERDFKEHIKDLIQDKSNEVTQKLARHKATFWLMNCSLDFLNNNMND